MGLVLPWDRHREDQFHPRGNDDDYYAPTIDADDHFVEPIYESGRRGLATGWSHPGRADATSALTPETCTPDTFLTGGADVVGYQPQVRADSMASSRDYHQSQRPQQQPLQHNHLLTTRTVPTYFAYDGTHMDSFASLSNSVPYPVQTQGLPPTDTHPDAAFPLVSPETATSRRRRQQTGDHVRHRRTRSGCMTCRRRRIKVWHDINTRNKFEPDSVPQCDEARPTCERCRKGSRDCQYPEPLSTRSTGAGDKVDADVDTTSDSSGDEPHRGEIRHLPTIPDEVSGDAIEVDVVPTWNSVDKSVPVNSGGSPPTSSAVASVSAVRRSVSPERQRSCPSAASSPNSQQDRPSVISSTLTLAGSKWNSVPKDVRTYIRYHQEHISYHHYFWKHDSSNFLKTTFLATALDYEPLLYAVTAFAAYRHAINNPDGSIKTCMNYYNRSLASLRDSLERDVNVGVATMLTMLQLAAFEEYIGDWAYVSFHTTATHSLITRKFTAENVMQNDTRRKIIDWYARFDTVTASITGTDSVLTSHWHDAISRYYSQERMQHPGDAQRVFEDVTATIRRIAVDVNIFFAGRSRDSMTTEAYDDGVRQLRSRVRACDDELNTIFNDPDNEYITSFPSAPVPEKNYTSIVDWLQPGILLAGDKVIWNVLRLDWLAIKLLFLSQVYRYDRASIDPATLASISYTICQTFEALQFATPVGTAACADDDTYSSSTSSRSTLTPMLCDVAALVGTSPNLGIAMTTLPRDRATVAWCAAKMASVDAFGYVYPASYRKRISLLWGRDVDAWWGTPGEGIPPPSQVVKQIMAFVHDREINPEDETGLNVRDLSRVFGVMNFADLDQGAG